MWGKESLNLMRMWNKTITVCWCGYFRGYRRAGALDTQIWDKENPCFFQVDWKPRTLRQHGQLLHHPGFQQSQQRVASSSLTPRCFPIFEVDVNTTDKITTCCYGLLNCSKLRADEGMELKQE